MRQANGCDIEVLACLTPLYDVERFGIINTGTRSMRYPADHRRINEQPGGGQNSSSRCRSQKSLSRSAPAQPAAYSGSATTLSADRQSYPGRTIYVPGCRPGRNRSSTVLCGARDSRRETGKDGGGAQMKEEARHAEEAGESMTVSEEQTTISVALEDLCVRSRGPCRRLPPRPDRVHGRRRCMRSTTRSIRATSSGTSA